MISIIFSAFFEMHYQLLANVFLVGRKYAKQPIGALENCQNQQIQQQFTY